MLRSFITQVHDENRQPDVVEERCVHSLVDGASCRACVTVCPKQSWILDDDALGLDTSTCDGCGLCVPVCRQGAIDKPIELELKQSGDTPILLFACERIEIDATGKRLPCIHAIGIQEILGLHSAGVQEITATTGNCDQCERGSTVRIEERLKLVNKALEVQGLNVIKLQLVSTNDWLLQNSQFGQQAQGEQLNRRSFLGSLFTSGLESGVKNSHFLFTTATDFSPPGQLFAKSPTDTLWPYLPEIDLDLCNGCDLCVRLCPHHAITMDDTEEATSYLIEPENCSGCNICSDLCDSRALSIHQWRTQEQHRLVLSTQRCKSCGVTFHLPVNKDDIDKQKCRICSKHDHSSKLFQVFT